MSIPPIPISILSNKQPTRDRRSQKWWAAILSGGILVIATAYFTREWTLPRLGRLLDVGVEPSKSDYVLLLNGDYDTRAFRVADLFHGGLADRVLLTSVKSKPRQMEPKVNEVAQTILERCGVPKDRIDFIDSKCGTTFDEAHTLATFMEQHPKATFSVVTNTYHTRRSRWVMSHVLGDEMSRVQIVSAPTDAYNASNWWKHEDGFTYYLSELLKSSFYFLRYGNGISWLGAALSILGLGWWLQRRGTESGQPAEATPNQTRDIAHGT